MMGSQAPCTGCRSRWRPQLGWPMRTTSSRTCQRAMTPRWATSAHGTCCRSFGLAACGSSRHLQRLGKAALTRIQLMATPLLQTCCAHAGSCFRPHPSECRVQLCFCKALAPACAETEGAHAGHGQAAVRRPAATHRPGTGAGAGPQGAHSGRSHLSSGWVRSAATLCLTSFPCEASTARVI